MTDLPTPPSGAPEPTEPAQPVLSTQPPVRDPTPRARLAASPLTWVVSLALAASVGVLLFVGGYLAAGGTGASSCSAPSQAFVAFCEAYDKLHQQFVDQLDDETLAGGAIQGMFQYGVKDPFSGYMAPDQYRNALDSLSGTFSGIGAEMGVKNLDDPGNLDACTNLSDTCAIVVVAPLEGSPAEAAGLMAGDVLLAVDGESVNGSTLSDEVAKVRGETGTDVTLTLRRADRTFDLTITRDTIHTHEVTSRMLDDGTTGYIALHGFTDAAANEFHDKLAALVDEGATAIIFDLRDNPGGYIDAARKIASEFVDSGRIFSQESAGNEIRTWDAIGGGAATDPAITVVVLVNGGSASASEIVTAALQEHDRATVIGQPTYGKNTVQLWDDLTNGGGVRITISRWFTPDHNSVAPDGIQPDVAVDVPDGTPPERDLYLEAAQSYLANHSVGQLDVPAGSGWIPMPVGVLAPSWAPVSYDAGALAVASV